MEIQGEIACPYCRRANFASQRGLTQHLQKNRICGPLHELSTNPRISSERPENRNDVSRNPSGANHGEAESLASDNQGDPDPEDAAHACHDVDAVVAQLEAHFDDDFVDEMSDDGANPENEEANEHNSTVDPEKAEPNLAEPVANDPAPAEGPNHRIRDQFIEYCAHMTLHSGPFSEDERVAIELLDLLRRKNAPLNAYDDLLMWHLKRSGLAAEHETSRDCAHFIGRKVMLKRLERRYNMGNKQPYKKRIKLPVSGTTVEITCHSIEGAMQRLLTDPRITSGDYLLFDDNPRAPPPEELTYVADVNTGKAFLETHAALIDPATRKQILLCPFYIDGASVSQFHQMEVLAVKIGLGIMTREARKKEFMWTTLGYVEKVQTSGGRGAKMMEEAFHLDHQDTIDPEADEQNQGQHVHGIGDHNVQDWHAIVDCILEEFVALQETGFLWDLVYKGVIYRDIHYEIVVPYIKCDNKEADTICGKYQDRTKSNQLCRYCHILTEEANDHLHYIVLKSAAEIQNLVEVKDYDALKEMSQIYLLNAFHKVRFSLGNLRGVHCSCPADMLHTILLGIFKYVREVFYQILGPSSEASRLIDALAKIYCKLFARQSDRGLPGTNFSKGIRHGGKMMAKEYRGILLVMLAMCRCTKGRSILNSAGFFKLDTSKDDWILLLEMLLEWEAYLNEPRMQVYHLKRLKKKHRYLMYVIRRLAKRTKGMGLKLLKFHLILHLVEDILQFGVPLEFDTAANESHHKQAKKAARLTQRSADTFQFQTALRMIEFLMLELAMEEIKNGRVVWDYFDGAVEEGSDMEVDSSEGEVPESSEEQGEDEGNRSKVRRKMTNAGATNP